MVCADPVRGAAVRLQHKPGRAAPGHNVNDQPCRGGGDAGA